MERKFLLTIPMLCILFGCQNTNDYNPEQDFVSENVKLLDNLNPKTTNNNDFLKALAVNYKSFALYNHYNLGNEINADLFAKKALDANDGIYIYPEDLKNWPVSEQNLKELTEACSKLTAVLKDGAYQYAPLLTAKAQSQFDCWLSMDSIKCANGNACTSTLEQCRSDFYDTIGQIKKPEPKPIETAVIQKQIQKQATIETDDCDCEDYDEECEEEETIITQQTQNPNVQRSVQTYQTPNGDITVINNITLPENLASMITPVKKSCSKCSKKETTPCPDCNCPSCPETKCPDLKCPETKCPDCNCPEAKCPACPETKCPELDTSNLVSKSDITQHADKNDVDTILKEIKNIKPAEKTDTSNLVTRAEFTGAIKELKDELAKINGKLDKIESKQSVELAVGPIPEDPKQHVMEEVLEINFDFNKSAILPEYESLIKKLATLTNENKNMKVSIIGYTDTVGNQDYNFALGGRRAQSIKQELIKYGIPENQIEITSAGKNQNKVELGNNKASRENRRAKIIKEVYSIDNPEIVKSAPKTEIKSKTNESISETKKLESTEEVKTEQVTEKQEVKIEEPKKEIEQDVIYTSKTEEPEIMQELVSINE